MQIYILDLYFYGFRTELHSNFANLKKGITDVLILYATYELCELWYKGRGSQIFEADEFNKAFIPRPIKEKIPKLS